MTSIARRLLITVVVLVVLLVVADRVGLNLAERKAADTIQSSQHLRSRPEVDVAGFPFLTQLAAGSFDEITVTAKDVPVGDQGHRLDLSRVRVVLHTLTVARDFSRVHADSATATTTIGYAELGRTLGVRLSYAGSGRVKAQASVTIAGQTIGGTITARPELAAGALSFASAQVSGAGSLASAAVSELLKVFALDIPLGGIPFDVRVQSLRAGPSGVVAVFTGRNLSYATG